ncbi:hypothetical protein IQ06DRAFT_302251 [Phaeosphaeriaceae sp. SRC1lsM3a]|nr:hypothetical protein IQ06DRAFT_302251 [Stagonospora sp. SRC1lsM3a]
MAASQVGLADQAFLSKIDRLRELNVKSTDLPQLVAIGDQSCGKSSVLESLTGCSFPQAPDLCTRYATQISCRREAEECVDISIIPRQDEDAATEQRLRAFKRSMPRLSNETLAQIIQEANSAMGIRMTTDNTDPGLQTFSNDTLKIEICGLEQEHFSVIDVPGIFRYPDHHSPQRTTCSFEGRPRRVRTMGVLTKPDLVTEAATQQVVKELVLGRRNTLRLGYCIVKNRGADDHGLAISDRIALEKAFFNKSSWREILSSGRCDTESLKVRLSSLLMSISKQEFPYVKAEVAKQLEQRRRELESMGPSRTDSSTQRICLGRLGARFQAVTQCALNGFYDSEPVFAEKPNLKLVTAITKMNESFANTFWKAGHKRYVSPEWSDEGEPTYSVIEAASLSYVALGYPELDGIIEDEYVCPKLTTFNQDSIVDHINKVYQMNGPELGTFSGAILSATYREQTEKWEPLVLSHMSDAIWFVHDYISTLLAQICPDEQVRNRLWDTVLVEALCSAYTKAMEQARFLLRIERQGRLSRLQ